MVKASRKVERGLHRDRCTIERVSFQVSFGFFACVSNYNTHFDPAVIKSAR